MRLQWCNCVVIGVRTGVRACPWAGPGQYRYGAINISIFVICMPPLFVESTRGEDVMLISSPTLSIDAGIGFLLSPKPFNDGTKSK